MAAKKGSSSKGRGGDDDIVSALQAGPLSTTVLTDTLGLVRASVYTRCRRMEAKGLLATSPIIIGGVRL